MENNAAMVVDSLLAKFGTTMDRFMPAIIDFGRYECRYAVRVCIWLIGVGIIFAIISHFLNKHINSYEWEFLDRCLVRYWNAHDHHQRIYDCCSTLHITKVE